MHCLPDSHAKVVDAINDLGLTYKIMGGYPRDIYLGALPRDLDIAVYNCTGDQLFALRVMIEDMGLMKEFFPSDVSLNGDPRLKGVVATTIGVDFIVWEDQFKTWLDVANEFDVNLNMFVLQEMELLHYPAWQGTEAYSLMQYKPIYVGNNFGVLKLQRDLTVTELRLAKMQAKARDFGWEVDEDMTTCSIPTEIDPLKD